jgi:phospholipid/cholesterol/gamma-HCH transport system ATP-binding protein
MDTHEQVICIRELYKSFGDLHVLNGVNLVVQKGENVAVLGKSGTGKSVLIKILVGLLKPDHGCVEVMGQEVSVLDQKKLDALRQHIGFSFQNSALYDSMDVYHNLSFPLTMNIKHLSKSEVDNAVFEALSAVGLENKVRQMPADLSGGQRKRIGIARTLILKPSIMLYDEPTAGLDPVTSMEINNLIVTVQKKYNTSSIIITHDLTCAKETANRIAILLKGKFSHVGTFNEVFESGDEEVQSFYNYNFIQ